MYRNGSFYKYVFHFKTEITKWFYEMNKNEYRYIIQFTLDIYFILLPNLNNGVQSLWAYIAHVAQ